MARQRLPASTAARVPPLFGGATRTVNISVMLAVSILHSICDSIIFPFYRYTTRYLAHSIGCHVYSARSFALPSSRWSMGVFGGNHIDSSRYLHHRCMYIASFRRCGDGDVNACLSFPTQIDSSTCVFQLCLFFLLFWYQKYNFRTRSLTHTLFHFLSLSTPHTTVAS